MSTIFFLGAQSLLVSAVTTAPNVSRHEVCKWCSPVDIISPDNEKLRNRQQKPMVRRPQDLLLLLFVQGPLLVVLLFPQYCMVQLFQVP